MRLISLSVNECSNHGFLVPGEMIPGTIVPKNVGILNPVFPEFPYPCLGGAVGMVGKVGSTFLMFSRISFNDGRDAPAGFGKFSCCLSLVSGFFDSFVTCWPFCTRLSGHTGGLCCNCGPGFTACTVCKGWDNLGFCRGTIISGLGGGCAGRLINC